MTIVEYRDYLVEWLKKCVLDANASGLIVGVSGGIDSALVANLIKDAFPNDHLGVIIPIYSSKSDIDDAESLVNNCKINNDTVVLDTVFDSFKELYSYQKNTTLANVKSRLRMIQLYALASEHNYLVVGTDNMCEWHTGYFTKFGDGGVDIVPLVHLTKAEVYEMAKLYNVPNNILTKAPSAGLGSNMSDEEEMGVTYNIIDNYLMGNEVDKKDQMRIEFLHRISHHKRDGATKPNKYTREIK